MRLFGLIGFPLDHSLSEKFFTRKFQQEKHADHFYRLFPIKNIESLPELIKANPSLVGLNVTIPYKKSVIPFLDFIDPLAEETGAVNCVRISHSQEKAFLEGFNTDVYGFEKSLVPYLEKRFIKALILGTGGSSQAVAYVLNKYNIKFLYVSRIPNNPDQIGYVDIKRFLRDYQLIINTTPLGMFPKTEDCPQLPYDELTNQHILYDLIYNPTDTQFLRKGREYGATTINGEEMFRLQAQRSWEIWNSKRGI